MCDQCGPYRNDELAQRVLSGALVGLLDLDAYNAVVERWHRQQREERLYTERMLTLYHTSSHACAK
jgi:hypothetical protein